MTLREQVEALPRAIVKPHPDFGGEVWVNRQAVLDLIDAHRCIDPERLARALRAVPGEWDEYTTPRFAAAIAAAYEEQG